MAYTPQSWVDGSTGGTPISAARLAHIESGVQAAASTADSAASVAAAALPTTTASATYFAAAGHFLDAKVGGVTADGVTDDTAAVQALINTAEAGSNVLPIMFPAGNIRITGTLQISKAGHCWKSVGQMGRPGTGQAGTAFTFDAASGVMIQLGTDNGHAWDAADYDGPGNFTLTDCYLTPATARKTTALNNGLANYAANTYAIKDWRGGNVQLRNVWFQGWDYPFWGIQSDVNEWDHVYVSECHSGAYIGPRSDQMLATATYFTLCDRTWVIDSAQGFRDVASQIVECGSATQAPIVVAASFSRGVYGVTFTRTWLEKYNLPTLPTLIDVNPHEQLGGATAYGDTYGTNGLLIEDPIVQSSRSGFLIRFGTGSNRCRLLRPDGPMSGMTKLVTFVANANTQFFYEGNWDVPCTWSNTGTGAPDVHQRNYGHGSNVLSGDAGGRLYLRNEPPTANLDLLIWAPSANTICMSNPDDGSGNITRFLLSNRHTESNAAPTTNTWQQGDFVRNWSPTEAGTAGSKYVVLGWVCTAGGTPGTWLPCRTLTGN